MLLQTVINLGLVLILSVFLWKAIEEIWDARIFGHQSEHRFTMNLSTLQALGIFEHTPGIIAVDVRPVSLFERQHLPRAISAPFQWGDLEISELEDIDRKTPVLVYCDGGFRSRKSLKAIKAMGFRSIYHLNRGIILWRLFSGPLETRNEGGNHES